VRAVESGGHLRAIEIDGEIVPVRVARDGSRLWVWCAGRTYRFSIGSEGKRRSTLGGSPEGLWAPMPGKILDIRVREGDDVAPGQTLLILEAMKMEHEIRAPHAGRVGKVAFRPGDQVDAGALLVEFAG
jgi:biotin carboxyl carrier protein